MEWSSETSGIFRTGNTTSIYGNIRNRRYKRVPPNPKKAYCDVNHPGETIFSRKLNIELREKIAILAWVTRSSLIWASSSYKIIYVVAIFVTNNCASILIDVDFCNGGAFIIQSNIFLFSCCVDEGLSNCDIQCMHTLSDWLEPRSH